MKEAFIAKDFLQASLTMIGVANQILDEYRAQNFRLSLRQLYYQLVSRDYIPNNQRSYKNLGALISNARQAGLIDWEMIEDRNRQTVIPGHWENPAQIVEAAARQFRIDKWEDQPWHIEVMVEKDALSGVLEPVCRGLDIGITANKGYSSSSTMYEIGKRLDDKRSEGKQIKVFYLGDHDPSGIDMTRDVEERLKMYSRLDDIEVVRLALNWDQVERWQPPENPAKETDARFASYAAVYGESSWELDAIEPRTLAALVTDAVQELLDEDAWREAVEVEDEMKGELAAFVKNYKSNGHGESK
jgi:hypothetical protein